VTVKEAFGRKILNGKTDDQLRKSLKELEQRGLADKDMAKLIRKVMQEREMKP
jgi:hypothetical protein